jgi:threonine aldolase
LTPSEFLSHLADASKEVISPDVYGDFDKTAKDSFLRQFEAEIASEFGKEDAVFMPSGGMAQQITLLIHSDQRKHKQFICHATSHLLLHEQDGFEELCLLSNLSLPLKERGIGLGASPLLYNHLLEATKQINDNDISSLLLELPHRELGGKLTPWDDILQMKAFLKTRGIAFHCDGARIFEATAGYQKTLSELAEPFDSLYCSFYKGLGSPYGGAMLLGDRKFCEQARIWLRRFGGNIYSLLPYAVAGMTGYRKYWEPVHPTLSFIEKTKKLVKITREVSYTPGFQQIGRFEPETPKVNMVHCYLRPSLKSCLKIRDDIQGKMGVSLFHRINPIDKDDYAYSEGFRCKLEIYLGQANGSIENEVWVNAWSEFCAIAAVER